MNWIQKFKRGPYFVHFLYEKITTSIAFLPTLMAIAFFILTGFMIYLEQQGLTANLGENLPSFLVIKSWQVAQSILTTLVGGLISLMVFSFSMVMVLLNNAASNYSPRILPGLIADKFHQFVLGTYLGTITYCLLLAINTTPSQSDIPIPGLSVLLGIFLGVSCLMLFVFFIHSISVSVQVGRIMESLHYTTLSNLNSETIEGVGGDPLPSGSNDWNLYNSDRSGHLQSIDVEELNKICTDHDLYIKVLICQSKFVLEGTKLFASNKVLKEELQNEIFEKFVFSTSQFSKEDYVTGFKQITEIAVKAMSPGINDPGTALAAIDYLSILFMERMKTSEVGGVVIEGEKGNKHPTRIWLNIILFAELLNSVLAPLRQYSKHDLMVMLKMAQMLKFLISRVHCNNNHYEVIHRELKILLVDAENNLTNPADFNQFLSFYKTIL